MASPTGEPEVDGGTSALGGSAGGLGGITLDTAGGFSSLGGAVVVGVGDFGFASEGGGLVAALLTSAALGALSEGGGRSEGVGEGVEGISTGLSDEGLTIPAVVENVTYGTVIVDVVFGDSFIAGDSSGGGG